MDTFKVRLNCVDHYQSVPTDLDPPLFGKPESTQRNNAPTLPVIRVFGSTETGQKVCAHIHGLLPYLYIEYRGSLDKAEVAKYILSLRTSIDHALATSYRRNLADGNAVFVAHVTLVKGVPFFGYHVGYRFFLKIYLLNPLHMTRLADLMYQGSILGDAMQPFESHAQYLAQWMCDYNLYGCSFIEASAVRFRHPVPESDTDFAHRWHSQTVEPGLILDPTQYPRVSHCSIEVDICAQDILNRHKVEHRDIHADFYERFNPPDPQVKLVNSLAGLWRDETLRRKRRMGLKDPSSTPFPPEVLVTMSAGPRKSSGADWIHENEFRHLVDQLISNEQKSIVDSLTDEDIIRSNEAAKHVETALESVEDLYPENFSTPMSITQSSTTPPTKANGHDDLSVLELLADSGIQAQQNGVAAAAAAVVVGDKKSSFVPPVSSHKRRPIDDNDSPNKKQKLQWEFGDGEVTKDKQSKSEASEKSNLERKSASTSQSASPLKLNGQDQHPETSSSGTRNLSAYLPAISDNSQASDAARYLSIIDWSSGGGYLLSLPTLPPRSIDVKQNMLGKDDHILYREAYYSDELDVPERPRDYAGREFRLESTTTPFLPDFDLTGLLQQNEKAAVDLVKAEKSFQAQRFSNNLRNWELASLPPTLGEVSAWTAQQERDKLADSSVKRNLKKTESSQIEGPTQRNKHGFKWTQKQKSTSVQHETQYMSTMSLEVHVNTRDAFVPDPEFDSVACVFWCVKSDHNETPNGSPLEKRVGLLALAEGDFAKQLSKEVGYEIEQEETELDLLNRLVDIVRDLDPDILTGYEVHNGSWGFLIERARLKYDFDLCDEFSRMRSQSHGRFGKDADRWGFNHTSTIRVTGRHMINVWRAMRSELNLLQYTMENVVFHLLQKRVPHFSFSDLTRWYKSDKPRDIAKCLEYYISRVQLDLEILDANELIPRTSEQARLIGVDFFSVFSRGSQFKVESFMFRIAKAENFILVSPSRKQVGHQNALECLPLVMEPQSAFYTSPLLVLDFQSLYPSIMIAYNYCYSTCLGRIVSWRGQNKMGFADFKRQPGLLGLAKESLNIAPNGMLYVKPEMRKSLLAKMLGEILETRVMVKSGMKVDKDDKTLQQLLNNRQLALKLLANVTYGYTSASFSGRMPCAEIADSIVQTARETLEKAIAFIHSMDKWGAEVVYGDTDSLFVYLRGRSRAEAFVIGNEIAEAVTQLNPRPIKLKFEKVYHPCVLLAKKRYVGFKYESPSQVEPEFDAKGIETVRRDGTPAEQKIEEKALKILFRTADLSQVKSYFQRQCAKVMAGRVSIQDFCYAREVKLGTYADKGPPPPGALISTKRMMADPRQEPQYGERVPYVVITGAPRARLIDRCVAPEELIQNESAELDAEYYISKNIIPPLERIFNLVGANVRQWYDEMPKLLRIRDWQTENNTKTVGPVNSLKKTLEGYLHSSHCVVCRSKLPEKAPDRAADAPVMCIDCVRTPQTSISTLRSRLKASEVLSRDIEAVCRDCSSLAWAEDVRCDSKDCPVYYGRIRAWTEHKGNRRLLKGVLDHLQAVY